MSMDEHKTTWRLWEIGIARLVSNCQEHGLRTHTLQLIRHLHTCVKNESNVMIGEVSVTRTMFGLAAEIRIELPDRDKRLMLVFAPSLIELEFRP